ncbi:MAG: DUF2075 domain-containing protein, partial [Rhodospirillaceae bacterium]|nr:DUF2075 domain-containing protein [Rhodospirillaceae bacterium]
MPNAYYSSTIGEFRAAETKMVLGELARHHQFDLNQRQRDAWLGQIELLKDQLSGHEGGHILFEFTIPRLGKRVDVVLIIEGVVFILEFKVGESTHIRAALEQAHDYALDLKNFHEDSHRLPLVPLVVTPAAEDEAGLPSLKWAHDRVAEPQVVSGADLSAQLELMVSQVEFGEIDVQGWIASRYKPTPTIVEAAEALYRNHRVDEITRSDAGRQNLNVTNDAISAIIEAAKRDGSKAICFVTGVPGAGKTLAGLNVATGRAQHHEDEHAVFLSGNGPLVAVLREALARDEAQRKEEERQEEEAAPRERMTIARARSKVESFVQNIHHFRDDALRSQAAPIEQVVVFDEAQRAWTRKQASKFMQTKRGVSDFDMSEPEFLISVMDRHDDWCVVICLVGGGQEINSGEAGIGE